MMDINSETPSPQSPDETCSVADALGRAKAELENVQAYCENVRQQAAERLKTLLRRQRGRRDRWHARCGSPPSRGERDDRGACGFLSRRVISPPLTAEPPPAHHGCRPSAA